MIPTTNGYFTGEGQTSSPQSRTKKPSLVPANTSQIKSAKHPHPSFFSILTKTMSEQVESAAKGVEEIRLDENGQPLSKNALKKLLKAEAAAKKKAEKAEAKVSH